ncbi:MAG: TIGR00282 family metallophosphoesterase [Paracoccaceae bacterium]|nr:TIGR00282 family metallophosphoesterase [Paracoccaceae bacterium]
MRLLYLGDVVGRSGRRAVGEHLPHLRKEKDLHFVVVNAENATNGRGLTMAHAGELFRAGANCLTLGDHAFDQREMVRGVETDRRILRPLNYGKTVPGHGAATFETPAGHRVYVAQVLGRVFMRPNFDDPFSAIDTALKPVPLGVRADAIIVDVHAEATSEKNALGWYLDGRVSLVVGSHTHIPTADGRILPGGTAYLTDAGMCGAYDGVIGFDREVPIGQFRTGMKTSAATPAKGPATVSGILVETDDATGLAKSLEPVRIGGALASC